MRGRQRLRLGVLAGAISALALGLISAPAAAKPGDLDPSFSRDGFKRFDDRGRATAEAVAADADSRIVAVLSQRRRGRVTPTVVRVLPRGRVDRSFGRRGVSELDVQLGPAGGVRDLDLDANGRIVVGAAGEESFVIARLLPDGRPDAAFAGDGVAEVPLDRAVEVAETLVAPEGAVTVVGSSAGETGQIVVARLTSAGELDPSYAGGGVATADFPFRKPSTAGGAIVEPGGGMVVAGTAGSGNLAIPAIVRLRPDGQVDPAFSAYALPSLFPLGGRGHDVALDEAGRFVVGACCRTPLVRLNPDGTVDDTFDGGEFGVAEGVVIDSSGRIVFHSSSGGCAGRDCSDFDYVIERRAGDGLPDPAFGWRGAFFQDFARHDDIATDVAVRPDGRIVVVGRTGGWAFIAQHETATGPPDADGDGQANRPDRCPGRYGHTDDGCPEFSRRVSILWERKADLFSGRLRSLDDKCVNRRTVEVRRRERGFDKILTEARTDLSGRWQRDAPLSPGVYYARVDDDFDPQIGRCKATESNEITIR